MATQKVTLDVPSHALVLGLKDPNRWIAHLVVLTILVLSTVRAGKDLNSPVHRECPCREKILVLASSGSRLVVEVQLFQVCQDS